MRKSSCVAEALPPKGGGRKLLQTREHDKEEGYSLYSTIGISLKEGKDHRRGNFKEHVKPGEIIPKTTRTRKMRKLRGDGSHPGCGLTRLKNRIIC